MTRFSWYTLEDAAYVRDLAAKLGLSGYAADMRGLRPALFAAKEAFLYSEFDEAERVLNRIECWIDERNAENWIPKSSRLEAYGGEEPVRKKD